MTVENTVLLIAGPFHENIIKIFLFTFFNLIYFFKLDWYELEKKYIFDVATLESYMTKSSVLGEIRNYKKNVKAVTNFFLRYSESIDDLFLKNIFERYLFKLKYKIKKVVL